MGKQGTCLPVFLYTRLLSAGEYQWLEKPPPKSKR